MELQAYRAEKLFEWVTGEGHDFTLLDVRNNEEFGRFKVEGPRLSKMVNVPYMEFIEKEEESVAQVKVPKEERIRIVCAKEGSAKYVGEILVNHGWQDVQYLAEGIKSWGNLLAPKLVAAGNGYELYQFIRPGKASCSYGLIYEGEMAVFDPSRNTQFYQGFAEEHGARIVKSFETHLQADYISGSRQISADSGAQIVGHENDFKGAAFEYKSLSDQEVFKFSKGGPQIESVHMPGHTPGSTSYLVDGKYMITGDTIFILSIGRPDLGGMAEDWSKMLFNTLQTKIAELKDDLALGNIKNRNADIYGIDHEDEVGHFIKSNMRKQPDEYAQIRKVNAGLLEVDDEDQEIMDLGKNECAASMHGG
jgi:glyoxylase-like metal-dependent hydrolase (beta-lactamase superfamily II)